MKPISEIVSRLFLKGGRESFPERHRFVCWKANDRFLMLIVLKLKGLILGVHPECHQNGSAGNDPGREFHKVKLSGGSGHTWLDLGSGTVMPAGEDGPSATTCRLHFAVRTILELCMTLLAL